MRIILSLAIIILFTFSGCTKPDVFDARVIKEMMKNVCDYQLANPTAHPSESKDFPNGWVRASFYTGVMATYKTTGDEKYLKAAMDWSVKNKWQPAPRLRHADDVACGQTYLELYFEKHEPFMFEPIKARFDSLLADEKPGREDWWWCDALFMSPPTLARLGKATGDKKYYLYMNRMYQDATKYLYDAEENLYYRDDRYFDKKTVNGKKVFWSRGNGWVMAGIIRILDYLPEDAPFYRYYVLLLRRMSEKVASLQGEDGLWRTSLLDYDEYPKPETSGSGFYCFALAAGVNKGYLEKKKYLPVIEKAWQGLTDAVHEDGKLGWVQKIGYKPEDVSFDDTHAYGAGAFLLAGSEMVKLFEAESKEKK